MLSTGYVRFFVLCFLFVFVIYHIAKQEQATALITVITFAFRFHAVETSSIRFCCILFNFVLSGASIVLLCVMHVSFPLHIIKPEAVQFPQGASMFCLCFLYYLLNHLCWNHLIILITLVCVCVFAKKILVVSHVLFMITLQGIQEISNCSQD